jgi:hypothetical protein
MTIPKATSIPKADFLPEIRDNFCIPKLNPAQMPIPQFSFQKCRPPSEPPTADFKPAFRVRSRFKSPFSAFSPKGIYEHGKPSFRPLLARFRAVLLFRADTGNDAASQRIAPREAVLGFWSR